MSRSARTSGGLVIEGSHRAARQGSLRAHNLGLVFREVLDAPVPLSRADISATTGLTRATVSALVDRLLEARLITEHAPVVTQRAGRPAVPLAVARGTVAAMGMEINVDYLGVCVVDLAGEVVSEHIVRDDFRHSDPEPVLDRLAQLAGETLTRLADGGVALAGVALALPGLVDSVTGPLRVAPNLGWRDVDVVGLLSAHPLLASAPPRLGNEATLAATAEASARKDLGPSSFVYVSGEVGVGGAIVIDGQLFGGTHGWSGEIGHVALGTTGDPEAGGTLEAYAGQDAILDAAGLPRTASVADLLLDEAPAAGAALDRAADALGVVLSAVMNVVDVDHAVLGGIYAEMADRLKARIEGQLAARVIAAPWAAPRVDAALAGPHPAMVGGAISVLAGIVEDPGQWLGAQLA